MARFTTLCSGSSANAAIVEEDGRFLLIDAGLSCRGLLKKIEELGLSPEGLCALLITHEHIDHVKGVEVFVRRTKVPVVASEGTFLALHAKGQLAEQAEKILVIEGEKIEVGGFLVEGFSTSHDAADCFGFSIQTPKGARMAIATDLGVLTHSVFLQFQKADLVAVEANYDEHMLNNSPYPFSLKQRIRSSYGHLSNHDSAAAVVALVVGGCRNVMLCHLSSNNNQPHAVETCLENTFSQSGYDVPQECTIQIAPRHTTGEWMRFEKR